MAVGWWLLLGCRAETAQALQGCWRSHGVGKLKLGIVRACAGSWANMKSVWMGLCIPSAGNFCTGIQNARGVLSYHDLH